MHKQSLLEEDECTQASHCNITGLGLVNLMGKMHCAPTKTWLHQTQLKAPAAQNPLAEGLDDEAPEERRLKNESRRASKHRSGKLHPDQHQGTCHTEKFDQRVF